SDVLDLVRVHLETRHYDDVLLAVLDVEKPRRVEPANVAGPQPAVAEHHRGGFLGLVPVAGHDLRPARANLADLVDAELAAVLVEDRDVRGRKRHADRAVELL